jgi:hypothetical protein
VFAANASWDDEKVIRVVRGLYRLESWVVASVERDAEVGLEYVAFIRVATTGWATSQFLEHRSHRCGEIPSQCLHVRRGQLTVPILSCNHLEGSVEIYALNLQEDAHVSLCLAPCRVYC